MPIISRRKITSAICAAVAAAAGGSATAQVTLPPPTGRPILRVRGAIRNTNVGDAAVFDRTMLEAMGSATFTTSTPWYEAPVRFDGVPMSKLMEIVGASGQTLTATALNDYSTDIPVADFSRFGVLLATHRDRVEMPVSDRGPLFIVYPYDSDPVLRNRLYYSRSAWSVAQLSVR